MCKALFTIFMIGLIVFCCSIHNYGTNFAVTAISQKSIFGTDEYPCQYKLKGSNPFASMYIYDTCGKYNVGDIMDIKK